MDDLDLLPPRAVAWSAPADQRAGRPLLVIMHGYGADEADLFGIVPFLPPGPVIASLRAPIAEGPGYAWFSVQGTGRGGPDAEDADRVVRGVFAWLDGLDPTPSSVGLLGFSQGAAVAMQMLRYQPRRFNYALLLSGFVLALPHPGDEELGVVRPPLFWGRGALDFAISREYIETTAAWVSEYTTAEVHVYSGLGHGLSEQELIDIADFIEPRL